MFLALPNTPKITFDFPVSEFIRSLGNSTQTPTTNTQATPSTTGTTNLSGAVTATNQQIIQALQKSDPDLYNKFNKIDPTLLDFLVTKAKEMGMDPRLVLASVKAETGGYSADKMATAVSSAGAAGINQIMPVTYQDVMNRVNNGTSKLPPGITKESLANYKTDPKANLIVSMIYLRDVVGPQAQKQGSFNMANLDARSIGLVLGMYNRGPYKAPNTTVATNVGAVKADNNRETRNHVVKTTNFAHGLMAVA
jgi:soluble lytic murein transglycosylase-like protein